MRGAVPWWLRVRKPPFMRLPRSNKTCTVFSRASIALAMLVLPTVALGNAVQWTEAEGGNGHWYEVRVFEDLLSAEEYFALALATGGYPASITSLQEDVFVYDLSLTVPGAWTEGDGAGPWLGAKRNEGCQFEWISGEAFSYTSWGPTDPSGCWEEYLAYCVCGQSGNATERWWVDAPNTPREHSGVIEWSADCNGDGIVDYGQILDGTYADDDGNGVPDICEAVQWTEAEGGNGHWYQGILYPGGCTSTEATIAAESIGGHLASLATEAEDSWVRSNPASDFDLWANNGIEGPWIGAVNYGEAWEWPDGSPWSYENWWPGNPGECCPADVSLWEYDAGRLWQDHFHGAVVSTSYLVEWSADCNGDGIVDYGQILDGTYADNDGNGVPDICDVTITIDPYEWSTDQGGNGHWYSLLTFAGSVDPDNFYYGETPDEHFAYAESLGGHTATMASSGENAFSYTLSNNQGGVLIGILKEEGNNQGGWVTGEPWSYVNWHSGEGIYSWERWGVYFTGGGGTWQDTDLSPRFMSIVEWEADCNGDGIVDYGQILDGTYPDTNGNGVPDCCEDGSCLEDGDPTTSQWIKPDGGSFHDADNWSTYAPPNQNMTAILEIDAEYTITFENDVQTMNLKSLNGNVTLDLGSYTYTASNDNSTAIIGENAGDQAALGITSGLLEFGSGVSGEAELVLGYGAQSQGDLHITGADVRLNVHKLRIGDHGSGLMTIAEGGLVHADRVSLGNTIGSVGSLHLSGSNTRLIAEIECSINHGNLDITAPALLQFNDLDAPMTIYKNGQLTGDGTITGYIVNRGRFAPDMSETAFQMHGDYRNRGIFATRLGESMHSKLEISSHEDFYGEAVLSGGLLVELDLDFLPEIGEEFQILAAEDRVRGAFDVAFMPDLGDDRYLDVRYPGSGLRRGVEVVDLVVVGFEDYLGFDKPVPVDLDGQPEAMAVADLDNDNDDDIAVSTAGKVSIYFNNDGNFDTSVHVNMDNENATLVDLVAGDFNGDEFLDLAGANAVDNIVTLIISNGDGSFMTAEDLDTGAGANPQGLATADFNNDGRDDLAISCTGTGQVKIWRSQAGRGVPDFEFIEDAVIDVGGAPIGIDPGEVEEDKDLDRIDLVVALNGEGKVGVLRNNTTSEVIEFLFDPADDKHVVGQGPTSVALADLDGDAHVDIVTANPADGSISILLHNETSAAEFLASVDLPVGTAARSVALADLDDDGDQDIALIAIGEDDGTFGLYVLRNDSNLTNYEQLLIAPAESFTIPGIPVLVDDGDLDSDGVPDLVTINDAGSGLRGESGTLGLVRSDPAPACPDDLDGSGVVDISDLLLLLADWSDPYTIKDLLQLLGSWGPCR